MAILRRLNEALGENAQAPMDERWIVSPVLVVMTVCALIASVAAGQYLLSTVSGVSALLLTWDGWRRYRRWNQRRTDGDQTAPER